MKKYTKTAVASVLMLVVSTIGFGIAFGYGGGSYGGGSGGSLFNSSPVLGVNTPNITPVITPAPTGQVLGVSTFVFNSNLRQGASSDDVKELQQRLTDEGVYTGPITGFFGPLTLKAVKDYQALKGLPQTGYVGPMTREALNGSSAPASNSNMTMSQFVELLIQMGVISPDKAVAARQAVIK
jgi:peptidoglycan hydrolase-like protein with peptidoglycan-binding domain